MSAIDGSSSILNSYRSRDNFNSGQRDLAGLTLDAVLGTEPPKPAKPVLLPTKSQITRTLLDIIREEEPNSGSYKTLLDHKDRKAWRGFKDRLRLRGRSNPSWTPSAPVPASDAPIRSYRSGRQNTNRSHSRSWPNEDEGAMAAEDSGGNDVQVCDVSTQTCRPMMSRRSSMRLGSGSIDAVEPEDPITVQGLRQFSRRNSRQAPRSESSRFLSRCESVAPRDDDVLHVEDRPLGRRLSSVIGEERQLSAREAAASQEAAEAEAAAAAAAEAAAAAAAEEEAEAGPDEAEEEEEEEDEALDEAAQPGAKMSLSLMDLLEQTDKQMGWEGSRYMVGEDDDDEDYDDEDDEEDEEDIGAECSCSICMVKHRGSPLAPCGHAYCKMCSRELHVSRSNCPVCNDFIEEILDVF